MIRTVSKKGALQAFYYLMAIDGNVSESEMEKFDELGAAFDPEDFPGYRDEVLSECRAHIDTAAVEDEVYDVIQEGLDQALENADEPVEEGVASRLLLWDMLSIAYSDDDFSDEEKRLIAHVSRKLKIEKDVYLEMDHLIKTAVAIMKELDTLNESNLPYSEVRPIVDEIEKRKLIITKAAEELIADEYYLDRNDKPREERKPGIIASAGQKIAETQTGQYVQKTFTDVKDAVGEKAPGVADGIKKGAGKFWASAATAIENKLNGK